MTMATSSHYILLLCLTIPMAMTSATQFRVGDSTGWTVPREQNTMSYTQWASRNRFKIGDSLLFVYSPDSDSVLQVTQEDYNTCNTSSYIKRFNDGNTVFTFDHSGPYYFISGDENHCIQNEKLIVIVMADRNKRVGESNVPPPSMPPTPPPAEEVQPSSPPSPPPTEEVPPPPPAIEVQPSPAPAEESTPPPPNGASLKVVGIVSSIGSLFGSLLVLVL